MSLHDQLFEAITKVRTESALSGTAVTTEAIVQTVLKVLADRKVFS